MATHNQEHAQPQAEAVRSRGSDPADGVSRQAEEVRGFLQLLVDQISESDRRHAEALGLMQHRLVRLDGQTQNAKLQLSPEYVDALARIEESMSELAARLAGTEPSPDNEAPSPLVAPIVAPVSTAPVSATADQDQAVPATALSLRQLPNAQLAAHQLPKPEPQDPADDPWDDDAADALFKHFESIEADRLAQPKPPDADAAVMSPPPSRAPSLGSSALDREWFETRMSEVAGRVETSLLALRPETILDNLGRRFDVFEERFDSAMEKVATRADVDGLRIVEAHILELTAQVEKTRTQLDRLDTIEFHIGEIRHQLTDDQIVQIFGGLVPTEEDLVRFAETAADQVAQRVLDQIPERISNAAAPQAEADGRPSLQDQNDARLIALHELMTSFVEERRRGEAVTAEALDTMQQAMLQLLNRVDEMNAAQARASPSPERSSQAIAPRTSMASDSAAPDFSNLVAPRPAAEPQAPSPALAATSNLSLSDFEPPSEEHFNQAVERAAPDPVRLDDPARSEPTLDAAPRVRSPRAEPARQRIVRDRRPSSAPAEAVETPTDDRQSFIAMARRAAEKAEAEAVQAEGRSEPSSIVQTFKARLFPGTDAATDLTAAEIKPVEASKPAVRSSVLLMASVLAILLAGYWFIAGPKTQSASPQVPAEETIPPPPVPPVRQSSLSLPLEADAGQSADAAAAITSPLATPPHSRSEETPAANRIAGHPGEAQQARLTTASLGPASSHLEAPVGITVQQGGRELTADDILRSRRTMQLAALSQQAAQQAAQRASASAHQPSAGIRLQASSPQPRPPEPLQLLELPPALVGPLSLRLAAAKGDPSAQFEVALRFAEGKGLEQDFAAAALWYGRAAAQGFAAAQYRLGTLYERGLGVARDAGRARGGYRQAADQGHVKAMHNLAVLEAAANPPEFASAARWFTAAAEHGLADSQYNLAVLHESGLGVATNLGEAYKWYVLAARSGDKDAIRRRDLLQAKLDGTTRAVAEGALTHWRPLVGNAAANDAWAAGTAWKQRTTASISTPEGDR